MTDKFDYSFGLSVDLGSTFPGVLGRQWTAFYHCLQNRRDRNLPANITKHLFNSASKHYKDPNSLNLNCIDKNMGSPVSVGKTLVPLSVLKIDLQCNRDRRVHALKSDFDRSIQTWAAEVVLQLCIAIVCIAYATFG